MTEQISSYADQKEHYRLKYDTLLATIIEEIRERFDTHSYHPAIELFELIRCCNKTRRVDFEKLKIYDTVLDFTKLEVEFQFHKLQRADRDWNSFDFTITYFFENGLRAFYPQIHLMIKLYLSIPIGSVENERSFSCLKILKNWL
jgi:hypothetical protein